MSHKPKHPKPKKPGKGKPKKPKKKKDPLMARTLQVYPKLVATLTVPDDFDETEWVMPAAWVAAAKDRIVALVDARPGVSIIDWHYHHDQGSEDG